MPTKHRLLRLPYARPSFTEGMARALDFGGTLNQYDVADTEELIEEIRARWLDRPTGPEADAAAIREVWNAVGKHIYDAIGHFEAEEQDRLKAAKVSE